MVDGSVSNSWQIAPYLVAAITGYVTYSGWKVAKENAIELERRKAKLARINDQIQFLYGPLLALIKTRRAAFDDMSNIHLKDTPSFFDGSKLTAEELRQWRLWRTEVFMPLLTRMHDAILENSHLIEGEKMPDSFLKLMEHVSGYRAVIANWEFLIENDVRHSDGGAKIDVQHNVDGEWEPLVRHLASENFPERELLADIEPILIRLRTAQRDLIESTQSR